eukprot:Hpha_TRINITY_DN15616_c4_g2::TRINITY_DN15616_c4_g2_i1::g.101713::m.101713
MNCSSESRTPRGISLELRSLPKHMRFPSDTWTPGGVSLEGLSTLPCTPPTSSALCPSSTPLLPASPDPDLPVTPEPTSRRAGPCLDWLRDLPLEPEHVHGLAPGQAVAQFHDAREGGGAVRFYPPEPAKAGELICSVDGRELGSFSEVQFSRTDGVGSLSLPELGSTFLLPPSRRHLEVCLVEVTGALEKYGVRYSALQLPRPPQEVSCCLCMIQ